jgi:hypothetical protein
VGDVGLNLGQEASARLAEALAAAGFAVGPGSGSVEVWAPSAEVPGLVEACIHGKGLLLCGGYGPLAAAFNVAPAGERVRGRPEPARPGLEALDSGEIEATAVTGVGYVLYRIGHVSVAVGGPRGGGRVAYLGDECPSPALAAACIRWLLRDPHPTAAGARS